MSALKGVNLGGWLVAERWMTPDLFKGVKSNGERALRRELGDIEAEQRLKKHRDTFITEADFEDIKSAGFDFVRLPVGYWLFTDARGFVEGEQYVDAAFVWAKRYNLKILLDFHGLQGSQNGHDHSGQVGRTRFYYPWHRRRALQTLKYLVRRYGHKPSLLALEVINEPKLPFFHRSLLRYYDKAFQIVKAGVPAHVKIIVSDAYQPLKLAQLLAKRNYGPQLVLDVHLYQVYGDDDKSMSFQDHIRKVETDWSELINEIKLMAPGVLVGEWSAALPAEAYASLEGGELQHVNGYYLSQLDLFDNTVWAHSYWSYKAPNAGVWDWSDNQQLFIK